MTRAFLILAFGLTLAVTAGCARETRGPSGLLIDANSIREPSPEEEKKIKLTINFDGQWKKDSTGSRAIIIISGKTGRIVGKNGSEIPIRIRYLNEKTVKIMEYEYNPEYLANWLPAPIAKQVYKDPFLKKTYSILRIIDEDTLRGTSYAWQVYHNSQTVQRVEPLVANEEWKRIKPGK